MRMGRNKRRRKTTTTTTTGNDEDDEEDDDDDDDDDGVDGGVGGGGCLGGGVCTPAHVHLVLARPGRSPQRWSFNSGLNASSSSHSSSSS